MAEALLEPMLRALRWRRVVAAVPPMVQVLDVGCGRSATFLTAIAPQIAQGIGIDARIEKSQVGNISTLPLRLEEPLPFPDGSFDVVTMLAVLEHLEREDLILQEIYRVLKHSGKLIITVPSVWAQPVLEFLAYRLKIVSETEIHDHKRYYRRRTLQEVLISKNGFIDFQHQYFQCWMNNFCTVVKPRD